MEVWQLLLRHDLFIWTKKNAENTQIFVAVLVFSFIIYEYVRNTYLYVTSL